jgi:hypothetical protein
MYNFGKKVDWASFWAGFSLAHLVTLVVSCAQLNNWFLFTKVRRTSIGNAEPANYEYILTIDFGIDPSAFLQLVNANYVIPESCAFGVEPKWSRLIWRVCKHWQNFERNRPQVVFKERGRQSFNLVPTVDQRQPELPDFSGGNIPRQK